MWRRKKKPQPRPQPARAAAPKFFQGELMTCKKCHRQELSDPAVEKHWTVVQLDGVTLYYCPICFGNATAEDLERLGALWS